MSPADQPAPPLSAEWDAIFGEIDAGVRAFGDANLAIDRAWRKGTLDTWLADEVQDNDDSDN